MARTLSSSTKVIIAVTLAVLLLGGGLVDGYLLLNRQDDIVNQAECLVPATSGPALELTAVNLQHASTINAVGLAKGVNQRARIIAIATAYQESTLRNLPDGDRDSVGLFQQRPSQGWGTVEQISDPVYSAGIFYDRLLEVDDWQELPLTEAAQAVQYSGHPDAYAKWEDEATTLVQALSGAPLKLSCRAGAAASTAGAPVREPLPGTAELAPGLAELLAAAQAELGGLTLDGYTSDGKSATMSVAVERMDELQASRTLAGWMVAHAATEPLLSVAVDDRAWTDHRWQGGPQLAAGAVTVTVA